MWDRIVFEWILDNYVFTHGWHVFTLAGIEWSLDNDASNAAVLVASEAHAITLAVEGLLGVVFTVATLTDEAIDIGEVISIIFVVYAFPSCFFLLGMLLDDLLLICPSSLSLLDVIMIHLWNGLVKLPFSASQWLTHCGWQYLMHYPLFYQGLFFYVHKIKKKYIGGKVLHHWLTKS